MGELKMDKDTKISAAVAGICDALKSIDKATELAGSTGRVLQVLTRSELDSIAANCILALRHQNRRLQEALVED